MVLLNVFWAQHGSKINIVSNLTYFAVLSIMSSPLLCCAYTSILQCPKSPTVETPDCHSVPTYLLCYAYIRKLKCPNSPTKLCGHQITVRCELCRVVVHGTNEALSAGLCFISQLLEDAVQTRQKRTVERIIVCEQERRRRNIVEHLVVLLLVGLLMSRVVATIVMLGISRQRCIADFGVSCRLVLESVSNLQCKLYNLLIILLPTAVFV